MNCYNSYNSQTCLHLFWHFYENAKTTMKMQGQKWKCKDNIKSYSLDPFEQVERSKINKICMLDPLHISCGRDVACFFFASDKESQAVLQCLQYEQWAGPQKDPK